MTAQKAMRRMLSITLICTAARLSFGAAKTVYGLVPAAGSSIWLSGNSTLHPYTSIASNFRIESAVTFTAGDLKVKSAPGTQSVVTDMVRLSLTIPVTNLKCEIGGLDNNLYDTLKYRDQPNITFAMRKCDVLADPKITNHYEIIAVGTLTISGKEREVTLSASADLTGRTLRITGKKEILMTDFGVPPPSLMFGLIVCENRIIVGWDLMFTPQKSAE